MDVAELKPVATTLQATQGPQVTRLQPSTWQPSTIWVCWVPATLSAGCHAGVHGSLTAAEQLCIIGVILRAITMRGTPMYIANMILYEYKQFCRV